MERAKIRTLGRVRVVVGITPAGGRGDEVPVYTFYLAIAIFAGGVGRRLDAGGGLDLGAAAITTAACGGGTAASNVKV